MAATDINNKLDAAVDLTNQYVIAPIAGFGIGGFLFSSRKEYRAELRSQITDNYNEKNIALQDNIANEPEIFTLTGLIGEIAYAPKDDKTKLQSIAQKLTTIAGYLPLLTSTVKNLQSNITAGQAGGQAALDASLSSAQDLYAFYKRLNPPKTEQAKAYNYFLALRNARVLISFDTPYGFKSNFAIQSLIMTQPENTETKSDIEIVLKEMRFATTTIVPFDASKYDTRAAAQKAPTENKGNTAGENDGKSYTDIIKKTFGF
jgi:phosphate/sulfate permease